MKRWSLVVSLWAVVSWAQTDPSNPLHLKNAEGTAADSKFQKVLNSAKPLEEGLGVFLDKFVGDCSDPMARDECEANSKKYRQGATGKRFWFSLSEDAVTELSPGSYDPNGHFVINLLPFFPGASYALTQGAPKRSDSHGNPLVGLISIHADAQEGWMATTLNRLVQMHAFRIQVVFTPSSVWSLSKPGGGKSQGVQARLHAVRVQIARTGQTIAEWYER